MFVGRGQELKKLEGMYQGEQFEFAVVYGRRRMGKTTLINQFLKDKPSSYYIAIEGTQTENLKGLSEAILSETQGVYKGAVPSYEDYELLLRYIDDLASTGERFAIAIDEYPYLAASYPAISSMIQKHIDQCWKDSKLFLILCGSSMSFMEEQVLGYRSPLYGRRTAQFKIMPFTFREAKCMYPKYTDEEQAILYGVTGGVPEYLSRIDEKKSLDENIISMFFDENGRFFEEPTNLLKQELKEPSSYHSILSAIASGASRMNEIATKTGLESSGCSNQIATLIALDLVKKEYPITENSNSRKTIYRLKDSMFLFWYRFVRPNMSSISRGIGSTVYEMQVKEQISDFMGSVFEEMCVQYLYSPEMFSSLPFMIGNTGRWWGTNKIEKRQEEIDIMSVVDENALLCECKWRNALQGIDVIQKLVTRGTLFPYRNQYFIVFAKQGFTKEACELAKASNQIKLVSFSDLC